MTFAAFLLLVYKYIHISFKVDNRVIGIRDVLFLPTSPLLEERYRVAIVQLLLVDRVTQRRGLVCVSHMLRQLGLNDRTDRVALIVEEAIARLHRIVSSNGVSVSRTPSAGKIATKLQLVLHGSQASRALALLNKHRDRSEKLSADFARFAAVTSPRLQFVKM